MPQDFAKARELHERAAAKDYVSSMVVLGILHRAGQGGPVDFNKAREWTEKAAVRGEDDAMYRLGNLYRDGGPGLSMDFAKAREWYQKAATKDNIPAMLSLGRLLEDSKGAHRNCRAALDWYRRAAKNVHFRSSAQARIDVLEKECG
ncbi:MAG: tetratricopeptide repeat protein [Hyphomicrobiaceae bacterium]